MTFLDLFLEIVLVFFFDDILVYRKTESEHLEHLKVVVCFVVTFFCGEQDEM